jgi:PAS domain S-box-containing protein
VKTLRARLLQQAFHPDPNGMKAHDNLSLMTWHARPDMSCEYVNRAWREFTGYTTEQALGEGWTRCLHPEDLARWLEVSVRAFDERAPFEIEYRLRRRDGEYRWVHERAAPRYSDAGVFIGFSGACVDVHKRHRIAPRARGERLEGVRVLVVGELAEARDALANPLKGAGADVRVAANNAEALATLGAWHPDVMLSAKEDEPGTLLATVARLKA